jgi:hypothetical protein
MKRSTMLSASLVANVVLLAVAARVAFTVHTRREAVADQTLAPLTVAQSATQSATNLPAVSQLFRWDQIESTNYSAFIANLRRIGCPEATIRDIITARVDALYAPKRLTLQEQETTVRSDMSTLRPATLQAIREAEQRLAHEESVQLAELLGTPEGDAENDASNVSTKSVSKRDPGVTMPLIFQTVDTNALNFSASQWAVINQLQKNFLNQIGSQNSDPNDPEYRRRWQNAQPMIDHEFRAMLGDGAFLDYQAATLGPVAGPQ